MINIAERLDKEGIKIKGYAVGAHHSLCPKCSHTRKYSPNKPCLKVTIKEDVVMWYCHHCHENEGGFSLNNSEYTPPKKIKKFDYNPSVLLPIELVSFFTPRAIPEAVLLRNKISYINGKICFPYYLGEDVTNIKTRTLDKQFGQETGATKVYYGINDINSNNPIVIVEGEIDKLSCEAAGYTNVVSVPIGATQKSKVEVIDPANDVAFSYLWDSLERFGNAPILIGTDMDAPGEAFALELARRYGEVRCLRIRWPLKDANEVLVQMGAEAVLGAIRDAQPFPMPGVFTLDNLADKIILYYEQGSRPGLSMGWSHLDEYMTIRPGEVSIVTGVPNSGKSAFLDAAMVNMATIHNWRFAVCSFENPFDIHFSKLAENLLQMPFDIKVDNHMTKDDLYSAIAWAQSHFFFIIGDSINDKPTIDWILERAKWIIKKYQVNGLIIDPYNEIDHQRPAHIQETEYVSQLLRKIRMFAKEYNIHIWLVAHPAKLSRLKGGEYPIPSLYDISGSANFYNKADLGVVIHRPDLKCVYGTTKVFVNKVRFKESGKIGEVDFHYDRKTGRYSKPWN